MAQFIQRSLLLAAAMQLHLVSVTRIRVQKGSTVTIKPPPHWAIQYCSRESMGGRAYLGLTSVTVKNSALTFYSIKSPHVRYNCYGASELQTQTSRHLYLRVNIEVCSSDHCNMNILEGRPQEQNSLILCAEVHSSQCCAPIASDQNLITTLSGYQVVLRVACNASGCPIRSSCWEMNGLHFQHEAKSWIDALKHCLSKNSSLVQITDLTVQSAVDSLLQSQTEGMQDGVWIGLERSIFGISIPWMWTSGSEVKDPQQWNITFPVDRFNNHCGKIIWVKESQEFKWLDANCHEKLPFMCQDVNE